MGIVSTSRRQISELLKVVTPFQHDYGINYSFGRVMAQGTLTINPIGTVLIYNGTSSDWEVFVAQDIATEQLKSQAANELPDNAILCVTVGTYEGVGKNVADVTLDGTDQEFTVLFRGPAAISSLEIDANGSVILDEAYLQLEKQGIAIVASATAADPSFVV